VKRYLNRSTLHDLRQQLGETVMKWPLVKEVVSESERVDIPVEYQLIVYNRFDIEGIVDIEGKVIVI
jgi:hypothetical protein